MAQVPAISVVTPTRNRAGLLRATMDSLRSQTFRDFEHIVIDGASTDGTEELLSAYFGTKMEPPPDVTYTSPGGALMPLTVEEERR